MQNDTCRTSKRSAHDGGPDSPRYSDSAGSACGLASRRLGLLTSHCMASASTGYLAPESQSKGVGSVTFFAAAVQLFAAFPLFAWLQAGYLSRQTNISPLCRRCRKLLF